MSAPNTRPYVPFRESGERREFEAILLSRRRSKELNDKMMKSLKGASRYADVTITNEMKKVYETQAKLNNRIEDLKQERLSRWSSLPRIDEKCELFCLNPYPVTFQTIRPVKQLDGGKTYPTRQRRKSLEFEDLPILSYEQRDGDDESVFMQSSNLRREILFRESINAEKISQAQKAAKTNDGKETSKENVKQTKLSPNTHRAQSKKKSPLPPRKHAPNDNASPNLRRTKNLSPVVQKKMDTKKSPTLQQKTNNNVKFSSLDQRKLPNKIQNSSTSPKLKTASETLSNTNENGAVPVKADATVKPFASIADTFSKTDKQMILNSPLSRRKLNSVLENKLKSVESATIS